VYNVVLGKLGGEGP